MSSYQYRKSHCGDKTVVRSSYLHNGISYTGKMSSLYWIGALMSFSMSNWLAILIMCNWHWFKSDGGCLLIKWDTSTPYHKSSMALSNMILTFNGIGNFVCTHYWGLGLLLCCKITFVLITKFMESTIIKSKVPHGYDCFQTLISPIDL